MKKIWIMIFAMILAVSLVACGDDGISKDATKYMATSVAMMGIEMEPGEIFEGEVSLALDENGSAEFIADGESYNCKWNVDGEVFTLLQGQDEFTGTMVGDVVTMVNMMDMGMDIAFLKEGATPVVDTPPEEMADEPPVPEEVSSDSPVGTYLLSGMEMYGMKLSYADIQMVEMEMSLDFHDDGTIEITSFGETAPVTVDSERKTMVIDDISYDYYLKGDQIIISSEIEGVIMNMTMTAESSDKWPQIEAEGSTMENGFIDDDEETTVSVQSLSAPSAWYGTVTISDYVGEYDYMEGTHEAWGYIGTLDDRTFFELEIPGIYDDGDVVASFYIDLDTFSFHPVVGEASWIFERDITEEDATWYIGSLMHGVLSASLDYETDEESFQFDYALSMIEGSDIALEEPTETTPVEPESSAVIPESLTKAQLLEAFDALEALSDEERVKLDYEDVVATYLHGVEGEIYRDNEEYKVYLWRSQEAETSLIQIDFHMDENGDWGCGNRYTANLW